MRKATRTIAKTMTIASTIHPHGVEDDVETAVVLDVVVGCVVVVDRCVVVVVGAMVVVVVGAGVVVVVGAGVVVVVGASVDVVVVGWAPAGATGESRTRVGTTTIATSPDARHRPLWSMRAA
jgi:hypothetical protein